MVTALKLNVIQDVVRRRRVALGEIPPEDAKLAAAFAYWQAKRRSGMLPARKDIDILELRPLIGTTHMVDVSDPAPKNYRVRLHGGSVPPDVEKKMNNRTLDQCGSKIMGDTLMEDYGAVAFTGVPSFHHVIMSIDMIRHSYSRLVLPLADDGRKVDTLMVCFNRREFSDFRL